MKPSDLFAVKGSWLRNSYFGKIQGTHKVILKDYDTGLNESNCYCLAGGIRKCYSDDLLNNPEQAKIFEQYVIEVANLINPTFPETKLHSAEQRLIRFSDLTLYDNEVSRLRAEEKLTRENVEEACRIKCYELCIQAEENLTKRGVRLDFVGA